MAIYRCTERPFPGIHMVSPICNAYLTFDQEGKLDSFEVARMVGVPHELIEETIEALPAFTGKGKSGGKTIVRDSETTEESRSRKGEESEGTGDRL